MMLASLMTWRFAVHRIFAYMSCFVLFFFFFSSRRRHTRFKCDWSSDVCSSDLADQRPQSRQQFVQLERLGQVIVGAGIRSEERRVGKECRSRWSPYH